MDALRYSPCNRMGLAPDGKVFPCLDKDWNDRPCPVNAARREWIRECQAEMYKRGYPFSSWVVRKKAFGLCAECALLFTCEKPTPENAEELCGPGVQRITPTE